MAERRDKPDTPGDGDTPGAMETSGAMEAKGAILQSLADFVRETFGPESLDYWRDQLPEESRRIFLGEIDADAWYPLQEGLVTPAERLLELFYGGNEAMARVLGYHNAEKAVRGFMKFLARLASPGALLRRANSIIRSYYRPCRSEVTLNEKKRAGFRISEFPEMSPLLEYRIQGWIEKALEISGARNPRVEIVSSLAGGDEYCEFMAHWE